MRSAERLQLAAAILATVTSLGAVVSGEINILQATIGVVLAVFWAGCAIDESTRIFAGFYFIGIGAFIGIDGLVYCSSDFLSSSAAGGALGAAIWLGCLPFYLAKANRNQTKHDTVEALKWSFAAILAGLAVGTVPYSLRIRFTSSEFNAQDFEMMQRIAAGVSLTFAIPYLLASIMCGCAWLAGSEEGNDDQPPSRS